MLAAPPAPLKPRKNGSHFGLGWDVVLSRPGRHPLQQERRCARHPRLYRAPAGRPGLGRVAQRRRARAGQAVAAGLLHQAAREAIRNTDPWPQRDLFERHSTSGRSTGTPRPWYSHSPGKTASPSGTGPFFGRKTPFASRGGTEDMDLSPSAACKHIAWQPLPMTRGEMRGPRLGRRRRGPGQRRRLRRSSQLRHGPVGTVVGGRRLSRGHPQPARLAFLPSVADVRPAAVVFCRQRRQHGLDAQSLHGQPQGPQR